MPNLGLKIKINSAKHLVVMLSSLGYEKLHVDRVCVGHLTILYNMKFWFD